MLYRDLRLWILRLSTGMGPAQIPGSESEKKYAGTYFYKSVLCNQPGSCKVIWQSKVFQNVLEKVSGCAGTKASGERGGGHTLQR